MSDLVNFNKKILMRRIFVLLMLFDIQFYLMKKFTFFRESSLSDLNLDANNVFHNQLTPTPSFEPSLDPSLDHSLPTFNDDAADPPVFSSINNHKESTIEANNNNDLKTANVTVDAINRSERVAKALNGVWLSSNDNSKDRGKFAKDAIIADSDQAAVNTGEDDPSHTTTVLVEFQEESEEGEKEEENGEGNRD